MLHHRWKRQVLVVDDSSINRSILRNILSDEYIILEAENGRMALDILQEECDNVSAILLDIIMPVMDGYEFLAIQQEDPKLSVIPVIVTTQKEGVENEIDALARGASDFLTKPYNSNIIKHRIANIIRLRETATFANIVERDVLTGLYTKEAFYAKAADLIAQNSEVPYDILCGDVESFSLVNDIYGETEGDRLLRFVASVISSKIDSLEGYTCRLSGDTFVAILPRQTPQSYEQMIDTFHKKLAGYPINLEIRMKFGIFCTNPPYTQNMSVRLMCDSAKLTMESIKGKYDIRLAFYNEDLGKRVKYEQEIGHEMQSALLNDQFQVYYQPKVNMDTGEVIGAEALVRWLHPKKGFMSPIDFIPLFERNGFITNLDYYVWDNTCKFLEAWIAEGNKPFPISVNVSRVDIYNPNLVGILKEMISRHGLSADLLHLEITETSYTENQHQLVQVVAKLKEMGFVVEMDDFGTGYSSLNILNEMPIDILKLDTEFLKHNRNILKFVINLAAEMQLTVIAEGVETREDVQFLSSLGCCYGQGYFFAKPMPQKDFEELLRRSMIAPFAKGLSRLRTLQKEEEAMGEKHKLHAGVYDSLVIGIARFAYPSLSLVGANLPFLEKIGYIEADTDSSHYWKLFDILEESENLREILETLQEVKYDRIYHLDGVLCCKNGEKQSLPCIMQWLWEEKAVQIAVDFSFAAVGEHHGLIPLKA